MESSTGYLTTETKNWVQLSRERLSASHGLDYLIECMDGLAKPDMNRLKAIDMGLKRCLPEMRQLEATVDATLNIAVTAYDDGHTDTE